MINTLPFPLYHGTSTIFEDSIKQHGLGGHNLIKEYSVLEFLSELEAVANSMIMHDNDWKYGMQYDVSNITGQKVFGLMNYQHGQVYLSPNRMTAGFYSQNKYGSEALTCVFKIIDILAKNGIQISKDVKDKYEPVLNLRNLDKKQIVYEIFGLPIDFLLMGEAGQDVNNQIEKVMIQIEKHGYDKYQSKVDQINFRLAKPIPFEMLKEVG